MKRTPAFALFFLLSLVTLFCVGCAPRIYDKLPDNAPKGYVVFSPGGERYWETVAKEVWHVWKLEGENWVELIEGNINPVRIAEQPGMHRFRVTLVKRSREVTVNIKEGYVTPVGIIISPKKTEYNPFAKTHHFQMSLKVGEPFPKEAEREFKG
jgi:hypothetical protein